MYEEDARQEKRVRKIISKAAQMAAIAVGLLILSFMLPMLHESETTKAIQGVFFRTGMWLFVYSVVMFIAFGFLKPNLSLVNAVMQFVFLPSVGIMFAIDMYKILSN